MADDGEAKPRSIGLILKLRIAWAAKSLRPLTRNQIPSGWIAMRGHRTLPLVRMALAVKPIPDIEPESLAYCIDFVGRMRDKESAENLWRMMDISRDWAIRSAVLNSLCKIAREEDIARLFGLLELLAKEALKPEAEPGFDAQCLEDLIELVIRNDAREYAPLLSNLANVAREGEIRHAALKAVAAFGSDKDLDSLLELLNDPEQEKAVLRGLATAGEEGNVSPSFRQRAVEALLKRFNPERNFDSSDATGEALLDALFALDQRVAAERFLNVNYICGPQREWDIEIIKRINAKADGFPVERAAEAYAALERKASGQEGSDKVSTNFARARMLRMMASASSPAFEEFIERGMSDDCGDVKIAAAEAWTTHHRLVAPGIFGRLKGSIVVMWADPDVLADQDRHPVVLAASAAIQLKINIENYGFQQFLESVENRRLWPLMLSAIREAGPASWVPILEHVDTAYKPGLTGCASLTEEEQKKLDWEFQAAVPQGWVEIHRSLVGEKRMLSEYLADVRSRMRAGNLACDSE